MVTILKFVCECVCFKNVHTCNIISAQYTLLCTINNIHLTCMYTLCLHNTLFVLILIEHANIVIASDKFCCYYVYLCFMFILLVHILARNIFLFCKLLIYVIISYTFFYIVNLISFTRLSLSFPLKKIYFFCWLFIWCLCRDFVLQILTKRIIIGFKQKKINISLSTLACVFICLNFDFVYL